MLPLLLLLAVAAPTTFDEVDYGFAEVERDVVVNGVRIHVVESGPADGERVLLLHCFGLSPQVWREPWRGASQAACSSSTTTSATCRSSRTPVASPTM